MRKYTVLGFTLLLFFGCKKIETSYQHAGNVSGSKGNGGKPNIILIVADDVGYELLGCNGGESYATPNLDAMASHGVRFTNCYGTPECAPSRSMILTGKYNFRNYTQWGYLDTSNRTAGNMFQDAGYSTCYVGKWQLSGFEPSVFAFGFDTYSLWDPHKHQIAGNRYKSPHIYQDGKFLPDRKTLDRYADDWFTDYMFHFIDSAPQPYFVYYSMNLSHSNFSPTPDDPEFADWDPTSKSDPTFFPSMIKYMDKEVGKILDTIDNNTVVIFVGDNGSPREITSLWNGTSIQGGKGSTNTYGTHVPLIVYRKGIPSNVDSSIVDFTDFLPTLASISSLPLPNYGVLDGTSFFPTPSTRDWIFCHYQPHPDKDADDLSRWVQDGTYKRYGSRVTDTAKENRLYNITKDPFEKSAIPGSKQTLYEKYIDSTFAAVLRNMHN